MLKTCLFYFGVDNKLMFDIENIIMEPDWKLEKKYVPRTW